MHRRSQREPKKSICGGQFGFAMLDLRTYLWLQKQSLEQDQSLIFEFVDHLSHREP